jgi:hypothetical protein
MTAPKIVRRFALFAAAAAAAVAGAGLLATATPASADSRSASPTVLESRSPYYGLKEEGMLDDRYGGVLYGIGPTGTRVPLAGMTLTVVTRHMMTREIHDSCKAVTDSAGIGVCLSYLLVGSDEYVQVTFAGSGPYAGTTISF